MARPGLELTREACRVQELNTTALILAFLPYHAHATLFPQLLSIIAPKDLSSELKFLRPYLKPPAPIPRHVVTHSLSHRRELLDLLVSHVTSVVRSRRESRQLLAFFATVAAESIATMCDAARTSSTTGVTEELVLQKALPILEATFSAPKIPEFQIGGYMLATIVVSKIPMKDEVLLALMRGIVTGWSPESLSPALACLALVAQERAAELAGRLPDVVVDKLLSAGNVVDRLDAMGKKYRVDKLAIGLSNGILEKIGTTYGSKELGYVIRLLEESKLGPKGRKAVLSHVVSVAQNLNGFPDKLEGDGEAVRDMLATSLLKWSEQGPKGKLGKTLPLVFEENGVDVEMLELALRTVIRRPALPEATEPKAIEAAAAPVVEAQVDLDRLMEAIPEVGSTVSFLEPRRTANRRLFEHLQQMFFLAIRKSDGVQTVLAHELFASKKTTDAFAVSLLAKIWTLTTNPVIARATALKRAAKIVKANSKMKVDYQALIPLALAALADPAERVRREATRLVAALLAIYKQLGGGDEEQPGKKKKSKGGANMLDHWGLDSVYGSGVETENLRILDAADACKFLEIVVARGLQECVLDAGYIDNIIENTLSSGKKHRSEGRLKSSVKTNVLSFLGSHVVNVPSLSIQLRLLSMLNRVSNSSSSRTDFLLPALQAWIARPLAENTEACGEDRVDIREVEEQMAGVVEGQEGVADFVFILAKDMGGDGMVSAAAKRLIAVWNSLPSDAKVEIAAQLLRLSLGDLEHRYTGSSEAIGVLRAVKLPTGAFQLFLDEARADLKSSLGLSSASQPKRRKLSAADATSSSGGGGDIAAAVRRITTVAELLESQGARKHSSVLASLFNVLGDLGSVEFSGITYLQSILLSCTRDIVKGYKVIAFLVIPSTCEALTTRYADHRCKARDIQCSRGRPRFLHPLDNVPSGSKQCSASAVQPCGYCSRHRQAQRDAHIHFHGRQHPPSGRRILGTCHRTDCSARRSTTRQVPPGTGRKPSRGRGGAHIHLCG